MRIVAKIILFTISLNGLFAQSGEFIDSLKAVTSNSIIVLEDNCIGCIVMDSPCETYSNSGNPKNKYVIWKNEKGYHIKKFNVCGGSKTVNFKKWKNDPFGIISSRSMEIDTTSLKYPLSLNRKDSTWFETGINHYKYYHFQFLTDSISEITIKDYAFREKNEEDDVWELTDVEFQKNRSRYEFNNSTAIKELLDCLISAFNKNYKQLKVIPIKGINH
ncbi:hypothetical protein [Pontibacter sp. G13]|uniref:hypothetical protein n=1 Tax=Pontibacter sp. G13 TaxID=3074898 RepID=UPI002889C2F7|nr:hypothetical protein [Pontibacter sp. G13]WNJ17726.1 hypothetical protein RJD25_22980 [Pontibacter sp. G13]